MPKSDPVSARTPAYFLDVLPSDMEKEGIAGSMILEHDRIREMHVALEALIAKLKTSTADRVEKLRPNILLTGPTGAGKELVATALRLRLTRERILSASNDRFGVANCAGLSADLLEVELFGTTEGAFTGAGNYLGMVPRLAGYTGVDPKKRKLVGKPQREPSLLFLDEIGATSLEVQAKILRLIENREFTPLGMAGEHYKTPRLIVLSATNQLVPGWDQLEDDKPDADGPTVRRLAAASPHPSDHFRRDLFYRLGDTFHFHLPPLNERKNEIPAIAEQFYRRYFDLLFGIPDPQKPLKLPATVADLLKNHEAKNHDAWPGNGRQLHQIVRRAMILWDGCHDEDLIALLKILLENMNRPASTRLSEEKSS